MLSRQVSADTHQFQLFGAVKILTKADSSSIAGGEAVYAGVLLIVDRMDSAEEPRPRPVKKEQDAKVYYKSCALTSAIVASILLFTECRLL